MSDAVAITGSSPVFPRLNGRPDPRRWGAGEAGPGGPGAEGQSRGRPGWVWNKVTRPVGYGELGADA